jgi:hypothetical protein
VTRDNLEAAYGFDTGDFEDDLQIACATAAGLEVIVTRNPADFSSSSIPVWSPAQMIARLRAAHDESG